MFCLRRSKNNFSKFWSKFELQITLASQLEAGFGPDLGPKKFNIPISAIYFSPKNWSESAYFFRGSSLNTLLQKYGKQFFLNSSKKNFFDIDFFQNIFFTFWGAILDHQPDLCLPTGFMLAESGFGTRNFQDELEMALVFRSRGLRLIRHCAHDTPIHMRC